MAKYALILTVISKITLKLQRIRVPIDADVLIAVFDTQ